MTRNENKYCCNLQHTMCSGSKTDGPLAAVLGGNVVARFLPVAYTRAVTAVAASSYDKVTVSFVRGASCSAAAVSISFNRVFCKLVRTAQTYCRRKSSSCVASCTMLGRFLQRNWSSCSRDSIASLHRRWAVSENGDQCHSTRLHLFQDFAVTDDVFLTC